MNFYDQIINFYKTLDFEKSILPDKVNVLHPYFDPGTLEIKNSINLFYKKFYNDNFERRLILGINPGRHGSGVTGIAFTDTKRLNNDCGISFDEYVTHETSSVFVYEMIKAFGGPEKFYQKFYITAVSPLGFVIKNEKGNLVNYNYYDDIKFQKDIKDYVVENIKKQLSFGIDSSVGYCLGTGKNFKYLSALNKECKFFGKIIPLAHPRYIMQYKLKEKENFIIQYLEAFSI